MSTKVELKKTDYKELEDTISFNSDLQSILFDNPTLLTKEFKDINKDRIEKILKPYEKLRARFNAQGNAGRTPDAPLP